MKKNDMMRKSQLNKIDLSFCKKRNRENFKRLPLFKRLGKVLSAFHMV